MGKKPERKQTAGNKNEKRPAAAAAAADSLKPAKTKQFKKQQNPNSNRSRPPGTTSLSLHDLLNISLATSSNPSLRKVPHYLSSQRILLVGEGDFSFALALAVNLGGENIVATSLDTKNDVAKKYGSTFVQKTLQDLTQRGATVVHALNATKMGTDRRLSAVESTKSFYDRIIFNFPHIGGSSESDIMENQRLLHDFFTQCVALLNPQGGEIHVSLRETPFYARWNITTIPDNVPGIAFKSVQPFRGEVFAALGYTPKRTNPATREAPTHENAKLYIFERERSPARTNVSARQIVATSPVDVREKTQRRGVEKKTRTNLKKKTPQAEVSAVMSKKQMRLLKKKGGGT